MKHEIVARIRAAFPKAQTYDDAARMAGSYCVGGAFLMALQGEKARHFPDEGALAEGLSEFAGWSYEDYQEDDPRFIRARNVAGGIIDRNDDGDFAGAWGLLSKFVVGVKSKLGKSKELMLNRLKGLGEPP